jgi:hypothetical protein
MTISAMVAGVQAGRINAVVFIFLPFLPLEAAPWLLAMDMGNEKWRFKTAPLKIGPAAATP